MAVGVERQADLGMAEPLLDHLGVDALREQQRHAGVAQVVEADVRQTGPREDRLEHLADEVTIAEKPAVAVTEDWPVGAVEPPRSMMSAAALVVARNVGQRPCSGLAILCRHARSIPILPGVIVAQTGYLGG